MKRLSVSLVAITLLLFGSLYVSAQEQAAKPTFKEGDTWQFNVSRKGSSVQASEALLGMYELTIQTGRLRLFQWKVPKKMKSY